jgi:hypothetical protein
MLKAAFYLSEISVSNMHGGGITLRRVIGDDLAQIACLTMKMILAGSSCLLWQKLISF